MLALSECSKRPILKYINQEFCVTLCTVVEVQYVSLTPSGKKLKSIDGYALFLSIRLRSSFAEGSRHALLASVKFLQVLSDAAQFCFMAPKLSPKLPVPLHAAPVWPIEHFCQKRFVRLSFTVPSPMSVNCGVTKGLGDETQRTYRVVVRAVPAEVPILKPVDHASCGEANFVLAVQ